MTIEIYHQLGYRYKWNIKSIQNDHTGDGLILSPRHIGINEIKDIDFPRNKTIFDPQFFLPNQTSGKLEEYPFFPCAIIDGFTTNTYSQKETRKIAELCINYQINNDFEYLIIPSRLYGNNPKEYIQEQDNFFVNPFFSYIKDKNIKKDVILQIVIDKNFIGDSSYCDELLNWITLIQNISGIYLIIKTDQKTKQVEDIDYLIMMLEFIFILSQLNGLMVIIGYVNLESLLLSIAGPSIVTIGSFENTRHFDINNFLFHEKGSDNKIRSPIPRLYIPNLLQLIDYRYINSIRAEFGDSLFGNTIYQEEMFHQDYKWHFQKPEPYLHFFLEFSKQLRMISKMTLIERYFAIKKMIENAINNYEKLEEIISFDHDSKGTHLPLWLTTANRFAKKRGWC